MNVSSAEVSSQGTADGLLFTIDKGGRFLMTEEMARQFPFAGIAGDQFTCIADLLSDESIALFDVLLADMQTSRDMGLTRKVAVRDHTGRTLSIGLSKVPGISSGRLICSLEERLAEPSVSDRSRVFDRPAGDFPSRADAFRYAAGLASDETAIGDGFQVMLVGLNRPGNLEGPAADGVWAGLVMRAGERLREVVGGRGLVARYADGVFAIVTGNRQEGPLLPEMTSGVVLSSFDSPFDQEGVELFLDVTVAVIRIGAESSDIGQCFCCAERALQDARRSGVAMREISPDMIRDIRAKLQFETQLREAFEYDGFELELQPKKDLSSGAYVGFEALIRWRHPERGVILPEEFIPAAQESGLIVPITDWVLHEVCRLLKAERDAGRDPLPVSINVPPCQLMRREVKDFMKVINAYEIPSPLVEFELTESISTSEVSRGIEAMSALRAAGVKISVEDFGTGYSSLSRLVRLPVSMLKIDRSFVEGLPKDASACEVVTAITRVAHALDLDVVAEGVETEMQAQFLAEHGVEAAQGFLFSRPLPPDQAFRLAERERE